MRRYEDLKVSLPGAWGASYLSDDPVTHIPNIDAFSKTGSHSPRDIFYGRHKVYLFRIDLFQRMES